MNTTEFVYTTFIKSTQDKVWNAITSAEFTRQYWGCEMISDWKPGSKWHSVANIDKQTKMLGEVLESSPPDRLSYTWQRPEESDISRVTFELETTKDAVRLTVTHDRLEPGSVMATQISQGWPLVLSSLKSFLETGEALDVWGIKGPCATAASNKEKVAR